MAKIYYAILLCLVMVGCCNTTYHPGLSVAAPHDPHLSSLTYSVYIDSDFDTQERFAIEEALGQWNDALNGYIIFQVANDSIHVDSEVFAHVRTERLSIMFVQDNNTDPESGVIAHVDAIPGQFVTVYSNRFSHVPRQQVIAHEIGHLLGISHNNHSHSLMNANGVVNQSSCIDQWMIKELIEAHQWMDRRYLNYCLIGTQ